MPKPIAEHFTLFDILKLIGAIGVAIGGGAVVNSSSEPNERIAVLETRVEQLNDALPLILAGQREMIRSLDSIKVVMRYHVENDR
jgi:hypothetical protein